MSGLGREHGRIVSVELTNAGDELVGHHSSGATELTVGDAYDFSEAGGKLRVGGDTLTYTGWDDDTNTIALAAPTAAAYDDGDRVDVLPLSPTKIAQVVLDGLGDSIPARVLHVLDPYLREGVRDPDEQEYALLLADGEGHVVLDVLGKTPSIDPTAIATTGGDIDPDPIAVGETVLIALEIPDGYGSYDAHPNFFSAYVGQFQDVSETKLLPNVVSGDLDPSTACYVVSKTRFEPTGTPGEYELHYRYRYDGDPSPLGTVNTCPLYEITNLLEVGGVYGWVGQVRFDNAWMDGATDLALDAESGPSNSSSDLGDGYWSSDPDGLSVWTDVAPGYRPDDPPTNYGNFTYTGGRYGFELKDNSGGQLYASTPADGVTVDASGQWFIRGFGIKRIA